MEPKFQLDWQGLVKEAVIRRKESRLTQQQLATLAGVSKPTLNQFEQGRINITLENAIKILSWLGLIKK